MRSSLIFWSGILLVFPAVFIAGGGASPVTAPSQEETEQRITYFLMTAFERQFWWWIEDNDLDPTPIDTNLVADVGYNNERGDTMSGAFYNISVHGMSSLETTGALVLPNMTDMTLQIAVMMTSNVMVKGDYSASGLVFNESRSSNVSGSGAWEASVWRAAFFYEMMMYKNWEITEDGYVSLDNATLSNYFNTAIVMEPWYGELELNFENLSAGGQEEEVKRALYDEFAGHEPEDWPYLSQKKMPKVNWDERANTMRCSDCDPVGHIMDRFIKERFATTPISDMGFAKGSR